MRTMPAPGARDFDDIGHGDPWAVPTGAPISDRPDPARKQALQDGLDHALEMRIQAGLARMGDPPDHPTAYRTWLQARDDYRASMEQDHRDAQVVAGHLVPYGTDLSDMYDVHGHPMPTTRQGAIDALSASDFAADDAQRALGNDTASGLWEDMLIQYPDSRDDPQGVQRAAQMVVDTLRERGVADVDRYLRRNRSHFLEAVDWYRRNMTSGDDSDSGGRTGGLSGYGNGTPGSYAPQDTQGDIVEDIRSLQRQRGW
jgi:hypothetical protein